MCKEKGKELVHKIIDLRADHCAKSERRPRRLLVTPEAVEAMNEYFEDRDATDRKLVRQSQSVVGSDNQRKLLATGAFRVAAGGMMFGMTVRVDPGLEVSAKVE